MPNRDDSPSHVPAPGHRAGAAQYSWVGQEGPVSPPPPGAALTPDPPRPEPPGPRNEAFDRLPDHAKESFLQDEWAREMRLRDIEERRRATMRRYMIEGMVIFTLAGLFGGPIGWAIGAAFGTGVGFVAWQQGGGNSFGWIGALGYLVWFLVTPWGGLWGAFFIVGLCAVVGVAHRLQKFDGSEC